MLTKEGQILQIIVTSLYMFVWGMLYCFPIYFPDLKNSFNYSQTELNTIGAFVYVGAGMIMFI
jgi:hypothetical protein